MKTKSEIELRERAKLIEEIEGATGTLESIPYEQIDTQDLQSLRNALASETDG